MILRWGPALFISACALYVFAQEKPAPLATLPGVSEKCTVSAGAQPWLDAKQTPACRALEVIPQMTHEEKLNFRIALPRLGLNATAGSDGPFGLAGGGGRGGTPNPRSKGITSFPDELAVASTFDRPLARQLGQSIGEEFSGKGLSTILGPTVNLARTWHWGRMAESFGEDPYLMTELSTPEIAAIQDSHVIVVLKHYAVYDQETDRQVLNEKLSEKGLHEIYLPAFESAVRRAKVGGIFCAFASLNGDAAVCSSASQLGQLRKWGFDGFVRPEAAPDAALAAKAGTDEIQGALLDAAIQSGRLAESDLDLIVYHHLVPMFRLGVFDAPKGTPEADVSTEAHKKTGLQIAEEGLVLLKNQNNILPLTGVKSIAVIGDDAGQNESVQATNSLVPVNTPSIPSEAITARAGSGIKVTYERGTMGIAPLPAVPASAWQNLRGTYYKSPDWTGDPISTQTDSTIDFNAPPVQALAPPPVPAGGRGRGGAGPRAPWSAQWEGSIVAPTTGHYLFSMNAMGTAKMTINGKTIADIPRQSGAVTVSGGIDLKAGEAVPVKIEIARGAGLHIGWQTPDQDLLAAAVKAAKQSDVAVVFAGERAGEGYDRTGLNLPGDLNDVIDAVASANPKTIVVLNTAGPVAMPWLGKVAGVVEAWFPGQFDGEAIAAALFGDFNPSGRLPMTFPANDQQGPATKADEYPGDGKNANYPEGVLVGYRWYDAKNQTPLFPFGFGLSYTNFKYGAGRVESQKNGDTNVAVRVTNSGKRDGAEVVQLYVEYPPEAGEAPHQLKGFERVNLKPGESRDVTLSVPHDSLAAWDEGAHDWKVYPGTYRVFVGGSSREFGYRGEFRVSK